MAQHEEYFALISARLDGALTPQEEQRLREHLAECAHCRRTAAELEKLHRALMTLPPVEIPDGLSDRIMAAVAREKVVPLPVKKNNPWRKWLATAAVLAVIVGAGASLHLFQPGQSAEAKPAQSVEAQGAQVTGQAPEAASRSAEKVETAQGEDLEEDMTTGAAQSAPQSEAASSGPEEAAPREMTVENAAADAPRGGLTQAPTPDPDPTLGPATSLFSIPALSPAPEGSTDGTDVIPLPETAPETDVRASAANGIALTPARALELVVAHVNAGNAATLSNVYDEAALVCVNSLAESNALVNTVAYEGLTEDRSAYLFGVDAPADRERYSHFLVALDTGEVSQIWTLGDTAKNSGGEGQQWEFFESQGPTEAGESPQAEPSETPAEGVITLEPQSSEAPAEETASPESAPSETPLAPAEEAWDESVPE